MSFIQADAPETNHGENAAPLLTVHFQAAGSAPRQGRPLELLRSIQLAAQPTVRSHLHTRTTPEAVARKGPSSSGAKLHRHGGTGTELGVGVRTTTSNWANWAGRRSAEVLSYTATLRPCAVRAPQRFRSRKPPSLNRGQGRRSSHAWPCHIRWCASSLPRATGPPAQAG